MAAINVEVFEDNNTATTPNRALTESPLPQEGVKAYQFNPYDTVNCRREVEVYSTDDGNHIIPNSNLSPQIHAYQNSAPDAAANPMQHNAAQELARKGPTVLHTALNGLVAFIPYPTESYPIPELTVPQENLTRVFLGQLPYRVTHMELAWLCDTIAPGTALFNMETIMKKTGMKGKRLPTGCVHALTHPEHVDYLIECLSWRVLFDDCGIWFAQSPTEQAHMHSYCTAMKQNEGMRFRDRPYQPVVVQNATSQRPFRTHKSRRGSATPSSSSGSTPPASPPVNTMPRLHPNYGPVVDPAACIVPNDQGYAIRNW